MVCNIGTISSWQYEINKCLFLLSSVIYKHRKDLSQIFQVNFLLCESQKCLLSISIFLSVIYHLSICLSVCLSYITCLSINYQSIYISVYLPALGRKTGNRSCDCQYYVDIANQQETRNLHKECQYFSLVIQFHS